MDTPHIHAHEHTSRWLLVVIIAAVLSSLLTATSMGFLALRTSVLTDIQAAITSSDASEPTMESMDQSELARLYTDVSPSVVHVAVKTSSGQGSGSGVVLDSDGTILTNNHVIAEAHGISVTLQDGTELDASVIGRDPATDMALLKVEASEPLAVARLGDSSSVEVGQLAVVVGSPFGFQQSLTAGYISALGRMLSSGDEYGTEIDDVIQTDAAVNPGNSGGPLLNRRGEVIGITTAIFSTSRGFEGIGFAIPINTARRIADELQTQGYVQRPFLGVAGLDLTSQLARRLDLPIKEGVLVQEVHPGSAADEAGIRAGDQMVMTPLGVLVLGGDVIVAVADQSVSSMAEVNRIVATHTIGDELTLEIVRGDDQLKRSGTLDEHPKPEGIDLSN